MKQKSFTFFFIVIISLCFIAWTEFAAQSCGCPSSQLLMEAGYSCRLWRQQSFHIVFLFYRRKKSGLAVAIHPRTEVRSILAPVLIINEGFDHHLNVTGSDRITPIAFLAPKADPSPIEWVVRKHLYGSGWRDFQKGEFKEKYVA